MNLQNCRGGMEKIRGVFWGIFRESGEVYTAPAGKPAWETAKIRKVIRRPPHGKCRETQGWSVRCTGCRGFLEQKSVSRNVANRAGRPLRGGPACMLKGRACGLGRDGECRQCFRPFSVPFHLIFLEIKIAQGFYAGKPDIGGEVI